MTDEILDFKRTRYRSNKVLSAVFVISMTLFIYWFASGYLSWPYGGIALFSGLVLLLIVAVVRFFLKPKRKLFEYLYFFGKLALITAIFLVLMHFPGGYYLVWTAFVLFASGLIVLYFKNR